MSIVLDEPRIKEMKNNVEEKTEMGRRNREGVR